MSVVIELEAVFLPLLQEAERAIAREYPQFRFSGGSCSVGGQTEYQGHRLWLECQFPNAAEGEADSIAILVGVKHVTTEPMLCEASVEWGNGQSSEFTRELLQQPVPLSSQALQEAAKGFPELVREFKRAVEARATRDSDA